MCFAVCGNFAANVLWSLRSDLVYMWLCVPVLVWPEKENQVVNESWNSQNFTAQRDIPEVCALKEKETFRSSSEFIAVQVGIVDDHEYCEDCWLGKDQR